MSQNPYKILGISSQASKEEIQRAFKKLAKQLHPDRNNDPNASEQFQVVNDAFQKLQAIDFRPPSQPFTQSGSGSTYSYGPAENVENYQKAYTEYKQTGSTETYDQFIQRHRKAQEMFNQQFYTANVRAYEEFKEREKKSKRLYRSLWEMYLVSIMFFLLFVMTIRERKAFFKELNYKINPALTLEEQFSQPDQVKEFNEYTSKKQIKEKQRTSLKNKNSSDDNFKYNLQSSHPESFYDETQNSDKSRNLSQKQKKINSQSKNKNESNEQNSVDIDKVSSNSIVKLDLEESPMYWPLRKRYSRQNQDQNSQQMQQQKDNNNNNNIKIQDIEQNLIQQLSQDMEMESLQQKKLIKSRVFTIEGDRELQRIQKQEQKLRRQQSKELKAQKQQQQQYQRNEYSQSNQQQQSQDNR